MSGLTDLGRWLCGPVSRAEVHAAVGSLQAEGSALRPDRIAPALPGVSSASLTRHPRTGAPEVLTLDVEDLSLAALRSEWGSGRARPLGPGRPAPTEEWRVRVSDAPCSCLVIAELDGDRVVRVVLRRDPA